MAAKIYHDKDADLKYLKGKTCAVIGYGSQGHAHALNLKDSGVKVVIGLYEGSKSAAVAKQQGLEVLSVADAAKAADVIMMTIPDTRHGETYRRDIAPHLKKGKALGVAHGFSLHFGQIVPPEDVDVFLVAPKGPGHLVRRMYTEGKGVPSLVAIHQDATARPSKSRSRGPRASAPLAPLFSRPRFAKKPRPISSANKPFSAAVARS